MTSSRIFRRFLFRFSVTRRKCSTRGGFAGSGPGGFAGRVAPGDCSPGAPTDPGVRVDAPGSSSHVAAPPSRLCTTRARGNAYRCSRREKSVHDMNPSRRRRDSHCFQIFRAASRNSRRLK